MRLPTEERKRIRNLVEKFAESTDKQGVFDQIGNAQRHAEFVNQMGNLTQCPDPVGKYRDLWADYEDCWADYEDCW